MKKLKQIIILLCITIIVVCTMNQYVYATKDNVNIDDVISKVEFSNDFNNWVKLSSDTQKNTIQPKIYNELNTPFTPQNPLYQVNLVGASINSRYSLKDIIPNNVLIRNQFNTNMCWAFAGISSLETNLALNNYYNGENKIYDYSERHVNYATTRRFLNNKENEYGFNRAPSDGGQWIFFENYLTSGQGAINESEMPFEDNSDLIDINAIQNKNVETQVYDTVYFDNYNSKKDDERTEAMNEIKQHIQNYGSVFATIHGDSSSNVLFYNCYNNSTGAKYCNNSMIHGIDHAISIIGWDDNYSIDNFSDESKPTSNGAWIARNSWGENLEYDLEKLKKEIFNSFPTQCQSQGWNNASEIPNSFIEQCGYTISGNMVELPLGDHGYMYISYEDCNVGATMYGISKASDDIEYDNIYQYDELYPSVEITFHSPSTYLCNIFEKKSSSTEFLTSVSLTAPETYTCKVYVNPNGTERTKDKLQFVELKAGDSETISKGYHTLEFANPVEINSDNFAVVVEVTGTRSTVNVLLEGKIDGYGLFDYVKTETGKCFISSNSNLDTCTWFDLGKLEESSSSLINSDSSIKAFTVSQINDTSLNRIEISNPPNKINYIEGEDFDKNGMIVKAYFNNNQIVELSDTDYSIINGSNLKYGQTYVTIKYLDKSINQPITVEKKNDGNNSSSEEKAESSNMDNAYCSLKNIQAFYYTSDSSKDYALVDTEILGITRNMENDSYEYSYYLSTDGSLKNINSWIKINEEQKDNNKLTFKINSRDISNYSELSKATDVYIYIKESVTKGGNQSVKISKAMKFEIGSAKIEKFIDNAKAQDNDNSNNTDNNTNTNNTNKETTNNSNISNSTSPTKLPYTGSKIVLIVVIILVITSIGIFIRYEVLNKYVK